MGRRLRRTGQRHRHFSRALAAEKPLLVAGAINAYTARMAEATGFRALYVSGGGVAANSLGLPDLAISTMDDVLIDVRRITDATSLPVLVDIDTGWGSAFNIGRTIRAMAKAGAAAVHLEDQAGAKRCGHRPGKELVSGAEMCDRIKAAVDARAGSLLRHHGAHRRARGRATSTCICTSRARPARAWATAEDRDRRHLAQRGRARQGQPVRRRNWPRDRRSPPDTRRLGAPRRGRRRRRAAPARLLRAADQLSGAARL